MNRSRPLSLTLALSVVALGGGLASGRTVPASGVVYHDRDQDGVRDRGEPGIGGVRVSNGTDIVVTDAAGRYSIEIDAADDEVFVIKPRGWMTPLDTLNKPQFHYIHKRDGTRNDDFLFEGLDATGPVPDFIDFPLIPRAEPESFEVLLIGDPQPYDEQQVSYYAGEVINDIVENRGGFHEARFAIALGDLVGDDLDLFTPYNEANALMGLPVYNVFGNHDMNFMAENDADSDDTFQRVFGPTTYAFQYGPVHFVILENVLWRGFDGLRDDGFPRTGNYTGHLREDQLEFVRNLTRTIPNDELIVLAMHIPLYDPSTEQHSTPQHEELMAILSEHPSTVSFSAHTHRLWAKTLGPGQGYTARGTPYHLHYNAGAACGSWWRGPIGEDGFPFATMTDGTPNGYMIARFDGNDYTLRWKVAGEDPRHQMHFNLPERMTAEEFEGFFIVANVYMGTPEGVTRVRVIDSAGEQVVPWRQMDHGAGIDPVYQALYDRDQAEGLSPEGRSLREPREATHLYGTTLGVELLPGTYRVEAEFTDMFGQVHHGSRVVRITR